MRIIEEIICPSVTPPRGCPEIFPRNHCKPPKPPKPPEPVKKVSNVSNEICGNIYQSCNSGYEEYWKAIGIKSLPTATVSVVNKSDCVMTVRADLNGNGMYEELFTIPQNGQTKSVTLHSIASLEVSCTGEGTMKCSGTYCITLNYERVTD